MPRRMAVTVLLLSFMTAIPRLAAAEPDSGASLAPATSTTLAPADASDTGPAPVMGPPKPATLAAPQAALPMAAAAPALPATPATAVAAEPAPPPARIDYSYVEVGQLETQPYGHHDIGHGQRFDLSYGLGDHFFIAGDATRRNLAVSTTRTYNLGAGINTTNPGHNFFVALYWDSFNIDPLSRPGASANGYALGMGVRALPVPVVELYATLRYHDNPAFPGDHTEGECGFLYHFDPRLALGFSVGANSLENDYLFSLRWYY